MDILPQHLAIIQAILKKYPYTFYAFGSRVTGRARPLSDLDLCFMEEMPLSVQAQLEGEFEESDLPYKVDIVDYHRCSEDFKKIITPDLILFHSGSHPETEI